MRKIVRRANLVAMLVTCAAAQGAWAAEPMASDRSIRELLSITQLAKLMDNTMSQVDKMFNGGMQQALAGRAPTPEQQKIIDAMQQKMLALMHEEMLWEKWEPTFIDIYRQSFTQKELNGMLTFYKSEAGRALIAKMPVVTQHTMEAMPKLMASFIPKVQQLMRDTQAQLKAAQAQRADASPAEAKPKP